MDIFGYIYEQYQITKPIRLIELFGGIGCQAKALTDLGIKYEHYDLVEIDKKAVQSYNAIHGTNFTTQDITTYHLKSIDHNYCNIVTYSFPCQDLSLAGKGKGMAKGDNTRSGLLWEVERILNECEELPQILIMENVPQVHSQENAKDFNNWQLFLEKKGYTNYWQDLNATDYGIPQNRNRCFMVSILGDYYYEFPQPIPLKLKLKDMLEQNVDEKYYLSQKMINCFMSDGTGKYPRRERFLQNLNGDKNIGNSITTLAGNRPTDNFVLEYGNKALNETIDKNEIEDGDFIDAYNRKVKKYVAGTITTRVSESNNTFIAEKLLKEKLCDELINKGLVKEGDVIRHSYSTSRLKDLETKVENVENPTISPTLTTRPDTLGVVVPIKNATKKGYLLVKEGDGIDISGRMECHRGTVQKGITQTITTMGGENNGVLLNDLRIRKLTPRECWRLMGFKDTDFDKVNFQSNAILYKQAGNGIVVDVLVAIFRSLLQRSDG